MRMEEVAIIVVSVVCVVFVIAGIIAVSIYFCCGSKKRRKPTRYQLPPPESTNSQSSPVHQDEPAPKPLPKVGSSGLWMSKPVMHTQGPNEAYHQLKPNGLRKEPVMMREILSTPNVSQPTSGYIYQGNLRMYHSQQLPSLVGGYGDHRGAYYNEAFIYPTYVDAGLSHRSSMRFFEASGYYAPEHMSRESHVRASRHHSHRDTNEMRPSRNTNGDVRHSNPKPSRYQPKSPQDEARNSRSIESRASSKNKSVSSSTVSGTESVIERSAANEVTRNAPSAPASESFQSRNDERPPRHDDDIRTQADGKTEPEDAIPSTSIQQEPQISMDNWDLRPEPRDIPVDQQSCVDSVSDITDMESKGQKITTQAFEFLDTYISDADDDMDRPKNFLGKS